jgi:hypothetical protein
VDAKASTSAITNMTWVLLIFGTSMDSRFRPIDRISADELL